MESDDWPAGRVALEKTRCGGAMRVVSDCFQTYFDSLQIGVLFRAILVRQPGCHLDPGV